MKYLLVKEKKVRSKVNLLELNRLILLSILKNSSISLLFRQNLYLKKRLSLFYPYKTRVKNRCIITNRSRSVFNKFRLSRLTLKFFLGQKKINGLRKVS